MRRLLACFALLWMPVLAAASSCPHATLRTLDLDAAGLRQARLVLGAADLEVIGVPGLARIEVRGRACASDPAALAGMTLVTQRQGDGVVVTARMPNGSGGWFFRGRRSFTLSVRVPATLALVVDTGSGDVDAQQVAALDVTSDSGDLSASSVAGAVGLRLGSGDARLADIGSLDLRGTGSGDVHAEHVRGDVRAGHSGSGDLGFEGVGGSVDVAGTGSGDISARDVRGSVHVGATGSGDVVVSGVAGNLTVGATRSGDLRYRDVKGTVSVPRRGD
ncbi:MAG: DUF2807 domain-containing protein [Xanthomonadaceae bacterium]|nr:DUF2807 domain-containing protein [Xanthomonadaceae bacterium]MDE2244595.1 DUF2807 domain-containing protein [Xanthomonadaceae bacterium]